MSDLYFLKALANNPTVTIEDSLQLERIADNYQALERENQHLRDLLDYCNYEALPGWLHASINRALHG